jgi:hypothetical protein
LGEKGSTASAAGRGIVLEICSAGESLHNLGDYVSLLAGARMQQDVRRGNDMLDEADENY